MQVIYYYDIRIRINSLRVYNKVQDQIMIEQKISNNNQNQYRLNPKSGCPHTTFTPEPYSDADHWYHPLLGYPMCPLIGRYNKGEYRIGDVVLHLEFKCTYHLQENQAYYSCGTKRLNVPQMLTYRLRNIPQVIAYNKPKALKNQPDVHLTHHLPQPRITVNWVVSFGQIGKDFLNYLNHCYLFDETVFYGDKLNRTTNNIPIIAYLPSNSNIENEQVERGISMTEWRSEYLSIHLKGGAPAFSPNNMRLGVKGMKKIVTSQLKPKIQKVKSTEDLHQNKKQGKKQKKKYKRKNEVNKQHTGEKVQNKQEEDQTPQVQVKNEQKQRQLQEKQKLQKQKQEKLAIEQFWKNLQKQVKEDQREQQLQKANMANKQKATQHTKDPIKFVHFYTCVLLENDHRVNYHWHIQDLHIQDMVRQMLTSVTSVQQFIKLYRSLLGEDPLISELGSLLMI